MLPWTWIPSVVIPVLLLVLIFCPTRIIYIGLNRELNDPTPLDVSKLTVTVVLNPLSSIEPSIFITAYVDNSLIMLFFTSVKAPAPWSFAYLSLYFYSSVSSIFLRAPITSPPILIAEELDNNETSSSFRPMWMLSLYDLIQPTCIP